MTNPVRILNSVSPAVRPTGRSPGEPFVNYPDLQFGVVDVAGTAVDLIAVRFFSATAHYNIGDHVLQGGVLYRAIASTGPGAFAPASWTRGVTLADATATYLPLAGGTMTGPIVLSADPAAPLQPATKQYADLKAPIASPTLTGDPKAPTASPGDNDTSIATTAFVAAAIAAASANAITKVFTKVITATGPYTPTPGMLYATIECVGGGGGGGGAQSTPASTQGTAGGGGSGGYSRATVTAAQVGASQAATIGAAGAAGPSGPNNGGVGGATSLGSLCVANGGGGGGGSSSVPAAGASGAGAGVAGAVGDLIVFGQAGQPGAQNSTSGGVVYNCGGGGNSIFGGFGSGGFGATTRSAGGGVAGFAGTAGIIVITEYVH